MNGALRSRSLAAPSRGEDRTDGIDEGSARLDQRRGDVEQARLQRRPRVEPLRRQPPAAFRIAPPGARAAAGASTSTTSAYPSSRPASQLPSRRRAGARRSARRHRRARASCDSRWRLVSLAMIRASARRGDGQRLAPCPGAQVDKVERSAGWQASAMSWLPSSCTSTSPSANSGRSSTRVSAARRRPHGLSRVGSRPGRPPPWRRGRLWRR